MLKLHPVLKNYLWGGKKFYAMYSRDNGGDLISESWEVSVHPDGVSEPLGDFLETHPKAVDNQGSEFPILIKYIGAAQNLSVQVHPDDEYARRVENDNGKTEMWYIVNADDGAGIYCGFQRNTTKEEFLKKVQDGTVEELLNFIPVKAGDCFLIEAGTVHAIGAGCVICEIQQNSNTTYRVYDYNRRGADGKLRQLHIDKAVDVINFNKFEDRTNTKGVYHAQGYSLQTLTECKYFRCRKLCIKGNFVEQNEYSFVAVNVLEGQGIINGESFKPGDSFFVSCGETLSISGNAEIMLTDKGEQKYYAGIDLGGTFIKCGIVDSNGRLLKKDKATTAGGYSSVMQAMANLAIRLAQERKLVLSGIGIGCPGTVDSKRGVILYSNNLGWKDVPLARDIQALTGVPVAVTNDANAAALGEYAYGAGKNYQDMILITLGTGVGSGIVIDGKLFEGNKGAGAELGHSVIKMNGERCTCGRKGCLEAYASASALVRQAKACMQKDKATLLWQLCGGDIEKVDGKILFDAVRVEDKGAKRVFKKYVEYLACGLTNIANEFRPEVIVLGGGISAVGEVLTLPLQRKLLRNIFGGQKNAPVKILTAALENDAGVFGAVELIKHNSVFSGE